MCARMRPLLCASFCLLAACLHGERWYLIPEWELSRLETISQTWETDRQNLLLRLADLRQTAERLSRDSRTLSAQLKAEREARQNAQKSFERSEADLLARTREREKEIASLRKEAAKRETAARRAKGARNTLALILAGIVLALAVYVFVKLRNVARIL